VLIITACSELSNDKCEFIQVSPAGKWWAHLGQCWHRGRVGSAADGCRCE